MTKEQLIEFIREIEKKRAFSYEDQMKLIILDNSAFTVWASDRDCNILLWEGQCEAKYGYAKQEVIGKDFVELFVHPDEQYQAREDQKKIIDDGIVFHNLANDRGKHGNTLPLLTHCFRIYDINTEKYLNAELGIIIDYFGEEQERLGKIVAESQKVKLLVEQFESEALQTKEQFQGRKSALTAEIAKCQQKAVGRRDECKTLVSPIKEQVKLIQSKLTELLKSYSIEIRGCGTTEDIEEKKICFKDDYDEIMYEFENVIADFQDINTHYSGDNKLLQMREVSLTDLSNRQTNLSEQIFELSSDIDKGIANFKKIFSKPKQGTTMLAKWNTLKDDTKKIKTDSNSLFSALISRINLARDVLSLETVIADIANRYKNFEYRIDEIKTSMEDL
jgi:PAS domain S-box-containing protein